MDEFILIERTGTVFTLPPTASKVSDVEATHYILKAAPDAKRVVIKGAKTAKYGSHEKVQETIDGFEEIQLLPRNSITLVPHPERNTWWII